MAIQVAPHDRTEYRYDRAIALGPRVVRLRPVPHARTPVPAYSLGVEPAGYFLNWQQDPQGNFLARLVFPEKTYRFVVTVDLTADMMVINPFDFFPESSAETVPCEYDPTLEQELAPFRLLLPAEKRFQRYVATFRDETPSPQRTINYLVALNPRVQRDIRYIVRLEPGGSPPKRRWRSARDRAAIPARF